MGWTATLVGAGAALALLLLAGRANARRGIGRWSLVPWDYVMIVAAIGLIVALARLADLWREGL